MEEALAAATINAAAALGVSDKCGSLEEGKMADMLILNASRCMGRDKTNLMKSKIDINFRAKMLLWHLKYDSLPCFFSFSFFLIFFRWEHLIYQFGCHDQVIRDVIKSGRVLTLQTIPSACS